MHLPRAIGYTLAWCGATALAVGVAWLGVGEVLHATVLAEDPPAPMVVAAPTGVSGVARAETTPTARPTRTPRPRETPRASPRETRPTPRPTRSVRVTAPAKQDPAPRPSPPPSTPSAGTGEVLHTFTLKGGRAVVAVRAGDCRMVSATPADGYELKVWDEPYWLRITFLAPGHESSAFCTWNALPPRLDTYET
ncbi:hypothetical protein [Acrocarpospora catenulata]|uniref:hypothetical protein n=1 Tax=Acrocarpospora catenulata TaxID=2836182 RepID=UPI001BDA662F|nr:hypothetical protein [Acrocarpospora catenulata]